RENTATETRLGRKIAAGERDQRMEGRAQPIDRAPWPLDHDLLHVDHRIPTLVRGGRQHPQQFGIPHEKVRMTAQIRRHLAPGNRGAGSLRLLFRLVRHTDRFYLKVPYSAASADLSPRID